MFADKYSGEITKNIIAEILNGNFGNKDGLSLGGDNGIKYNYLYQKSSDLKSDKNKLRYYYSFGELFTEFIYRPFQRIYKVDELSGQIVPKVNYLVNFIINELETGCLCYNEIINDTDLLELVEIFMKHPDQSDRMKYIFLKFVCESNAIKNAIGIDQLYEKTKNEILYCNNDYNKHRITLLCMLMGAILIARGSKGDQRAAYLITYTQKWHLFRFFFSVLIGKIVGCDFTHINAVIGHFAGNKREYAWAMKIALEYRIDKLGQNLTPKECSKLHSFMPKLERATREIEQDYECKNLFDILFPDVEWNSYNNAAPRRTAAETQRMLDGWKTKTEALEKELVELRPLKEMVKEMRDAVNKETISMDSLCEAILSCSASLAQELFFKLDWCLEGKNEAWGNARADLKRKIQAKEEEERKGVTVNAQTFYATGSQHNDYSRNISLDGVNDSSFASYHK